MKILCQKIILGRAFFQKKMSVREANIFPEKSKLVIFCLKCTQPKQNCFVCLFVLRLNVPVNNFSVMSGQPTLLGFNQYCKELMCSRTQHGDACVELSLVGHLTYRYIDGTYTDILICINIILNFSKGV